MDDKNLAQLCAIQVCKGAFEILQHRRRSKLQTGIQQVTQLMCKVQTGLQRPDLHSLTFEKEANEPLGKQDWHLVLIRRYIGAISLSRRKSHCDAPFSMF
jgi:hypothetical protein